MFFRRGFSLLEVLLSVSVLAILAGISAPVYFSFLSESNLEVAVLSWVKSLRRAKLLAEASNLDSVWGAKLTSTSAIVFWGSNFSLRDQGRDEVFELSGLGSVAGLTEVYFSKLSGLPSVFGTSTLISQQGEVLEVYLNDKGAINY